MKDRLKIAMIGHKRIPSRELKGGAADFICQKYSWNDVVARTIAIYK